jgi:MFS family permease
MKIERLFKRIYFSKGNLTQKEYYNSRTLFIFEGCAAVGVFTLTSGAFLSGYAKYLGANDTINGIIGSTPVLAGIVQIISPLIFEKINRRKVFIAFFALLFRLILSSMVLIPVLFTGTTQRVWALALMYFLAYVIASFINPPAANWIASLTPESKRGRYFGKRESYINAFTAVLSISLGKVLDTFRGYDFEYGGFIIVFCVVFLLALVNFTFLSSIKEPLVNKSDVIIKFKDIITIPIKDKSYSQVLLMFILWNVALQVGGPFFSVYMVSGLKMQYTFITILGILSSISVIVLVRIWGKIADKKTWVFTTKASIALLGITHTLWFLMTPSTMYFLAPILFILGGASWAGIGISLFNIQFVFSPEKGRTVYIGFTAAMGGVIGFISTLIGSFIVNTLEGVKMNIIGFPISNMQIVFVISGISLLLTALFVHKKIHMHDRN